MRNLDELELVPTWVNPDHLVATAIHVMQGHKISAVAVMQGTEIDGLVLLDRALAMPPFAKVNTITQPIKLVLQDSTSVRDAAQEFIDNDVLHAAVLRDGEFRGLLSSNMLLQEVGRSWDPLTSLPWSNRLRDWGTEALEEGGEIALAFIDVDDFGAYNKRHGHIVGDNVLKATTERLREMIDRRNDVLVRYGGDEFVIGTHLTREETIAKYGSIADLRISVDDVPEPVTLTVGFSGGLRAQGREHAHIAATLDNLINLASQDCMRRKAEKSANAGQPVEEPGTAAEPLETFQVRLVSVDEDDPTLPVAVTLSIGGVDGTGAVMPEGRGLVDAVADAAAKAVERIFHGLTVAITMTAIDTASDGEKAVTVVGWCEAEGKRLAMSGTVPVNRDVHRAAAEAVAAAVVALRAGR
ncbi:MAG TPA: GGDEF domain-containing protein [Fimbriimonadaceae bacterium]|nr:GGDEF domain-containing protein [Fimbriimonadaceae bacterium]